MKTIRTFAIALVLGLAGFVTAANGAEFVKHCCVVDASCCTGEACCAAHQVQ